MSCCPRGQPIKFLGRSHPCRKSTKLVDLMILPGFQVKQHHPASHQQHPQHLKDACRASGGPMVGSMLGQCGGSESESEGVSKGMSKRRTCTHLACHCECHLPLAQMAPNPTLGLAGAGFGSSSSEPASILFKSQFTPAIPIATVENMVPAMPGIHIPTEENCLNTQPRRRSSLSHLICSPKGSAVFLHAYFDRGKEIKFYCNQGYDSLCHMIPQHGIST